MGKISRFIDKYFSNVKWTCSVCGKEIFNEDYFCEKCFSSLPFNDQAKCLHCGRKTHFIQNYCTSCKEAMTDLEIARSVFCYEKPISEIIKSLKYNNNRYYAEVLGKCLFDEYSKGELSADIITFVPMTEVAKSKRGYNQSELLAKNLCDRIGLELIKVVEKKKDTESQANLDKFQRMMNLRNAFKVIDKKMVQNKTILLIDDVLTTGATSQAIASTLKKAGASKVKLLTVASVPIDLTFD